MNYFLSSVLFLKSYGFQQAGKRSRYSDCLRDGRSGDRIPVGGEIFRNCSERPWDPPNLLYNRYRVFPGGKERSRRDDDPSPPSSAVVKKEQSYTSTPSVGRTACTEPQCLYTGALYPLLMGFDIIKIESSYTCIFYLVQAIITQKWPSTPP